MTTDLDTTNFWLAILAFASAGQFLLIVGAAFMAFRLYRQASTAIESIEHEQLRPFLMRANALIDDLQDITARARTVDDAFRAKIEGVESALHSTRAVVRDRIWPIIGVLKAVRAGLDAWFSPVHARRVRVP
jgi:hypothetical protein